MTLQAWHGAHRWEGPPVVRPQGSRNVEHGPGIYLATGYDSATKYARGGGTMMLVALEPGLRWLEQSTLPLADAVAAARAICGPVIGARIGADLARNAERMKARLGGAVIMAAVFVNLAVNEGAASGARGVKLAAYLAHHGIGASLVHQSNEGACLL
jgi:hypothetical protein